VTSPPEAYSIIYLTQDQFTIVSSHRYKALNAFKWFALWDATTLTFRAVRNSSMAGGKKSYTIYMHREIMGLEKGDKRTVDHWNHDTLDNTDDNIRFATRGQQDQNKGMTAHNTSGYKGSSFHKRIGKWQARIYVEGKVKHLGYFSTALAGHLAYCEAAKLHFGEFACFE
jgi:hypothetical protein